MKSSLAYMQLLNHAEKIGNIPGEECDKISAKTMILNGSEAYLREKAKQEYQSLTQMTDDELDEWIKDCIDITTIYIEDEKYGLTPEGLELTRCNTPKIIIDTYKQTLSYGLHSVETISIDRQLCESIERLWDGKN